ncbi:hypothetical protein TrST_g14065 [Triparma strigata]|uniref:Pre-rRNA-processing protein TSR2 n=1 Tax=Triparma strigata TaxID=1606541 RepID=A0A9W7AE55_9STRA|nr:hypothetical protein TrST_g14065 [Triparma strigata]
MSAFAQNDAVAEFSAGVTATLRRWTALRAAIDGEWGGGDCRSKAEAIRSHILSMFVTSPTIKYTATDVEDYLYIQMEESFCCQLEDGSPADLGSIIYEMAVKCHGGDFTLSRTMVDFAEKEREALEKKMEVKVLVEGEDFEEDEEDMDVEGMGVGGSLEQSTTTGMTSMADYASQPVFGGPQQVQKELPPPRQLGEEEVVVEKEKIVDEDGFEQVVRRSKRKNKGVKG